MPNKKSLKKEINQKLLTYITTGFGLVAGLAWNDSIKSFIEYFFPIEKGTIWAKFIYALIITVILVVVTRYLTAIFSDKEEDKK